MAASRTIANLDDLRDVQTSGATDGQALAYDFATQTWGPQTVAGGGGIPSAQLYRNNTPFTVPGAMNFGGAAVSADKGYTDDSRVLELGPTVSGEKAQIILKANGTYLVAGSGSWTDGGAVNGLGVRVFGTGFDYFAVSDFRTGPGAAQSFAALLVVLAGDPVPQTLELHAESAAAGQIWTVLSVSYLGQYEDQSNAVAFP